MEVTPALGSIKLWKALQLVVGLIGLTMMACLIFAPPIGVMMFWNFLIPVAPVERLYGSAVAFSAPNTHCGDCRRCSLPCPDWTVGGTIAAPRGNWSARLSEVLMAGAFPGWIWGWFLLPDDWALAGIQSVLTLYGYPALGALIGATLYLLALRLAGPSRGGVVLQIGAASAVSLYYVFRLPQLFGFNPMHNNGMLIDLTPWLPSWSMAVPNVATTAFFFWWLVARGKGTRPWSVRPPFAAQGTSSKSTG